MQLKRVANEQKVWSSVRFYYKIKTLTIHGSFKKREFVNIVATRLSLSKKGVRDNLKTLLKLGYLIEDEKFISLISYDKLWTLLNVPHTSKSGFRLIKTDLSSFEDKIHFEEISFVLKKQEKQIQEQYLKTTVQTSDADKPVKGNLRKRLLKQFDRIRKFLIARQFNLIRSTMNSFVEYNWENTLTTKSVAELFGYTTAMQGYYIQQSLLKKGFLNILSRKEKPLLICKNVTLEMVRAMNLDPSFYLCKNNLYKRLPNLISIS